MSAEDYFDPWTQLSVSTELVGPALCPKTIQGVQPLDTQLGLTSPETVPDELYDVLFGQVEPIAEELAKAIDDPAKVPPLHCYAILDAAKVTNLPELLEASGLEHRCLFKGAAYSELKYVAPWIVRLEDGNKFTRDLFTRSHAPWHLWDNEPGINIRSRGTLDEMWAHFRKFTKVRDEQGKWFYFRFWEAAFLEAVLLEGDARTSAQLRAKGALIIRSADRWSIIPQHFVRQADTSYGPFCLRRKDIEALRLVSSKQYLARLETWLEESYGPHVRISNLSQADVVRTLTVHAWREGLFSERAIADYVAIGWLTGSLPLLSGADPSRRPAQLSQLKDEAFLKASGVEELT